MKNRYTIMALLCLFTLHARSQGYPMETMGSPVNSCTADNYTGWTNHGILQFSGTAEVQNMNPSNNLNASGSGNVFFTNTTGTYLQMAGFNPSNSPASMDITFAMYGYNVNNLNELVLEYSTNGTTYTPLPYKRLFRNYLPPTPWDVMVSDPLPASVGFTQVKLRFRQTSSTQQFRIDDIEASFYATLPIQLLSFSAVKSAAGVALHWTANTTSEKEWFVLEYSKDARHFTPLATIPVTSVGESGYGYNDKISQEKIFYRLKMTDTDGKTAYSSIIYVSAQVETARLLQAAYPVPASDVLNTRLFSHTKKTVAVSLTDLSGKKVLQQSITVTPGINTCRLFIDRLPPGPYVLHVAAGTQTESKAILIQ